MAQSPSAANQGVAILCGSRITDIKAVNPALWTKCTITVKVRVEGLRSPVFVVGHYS